MKHTLPEWRDITHNQKDEYNSVVSHPLQTYEWGEFRKKTGLKIIRKGLFQDNTLIDGATITLHPVPKTPWNLGYLPKGKLPSTILLDELQTVGREHNCISIQFEPHVVKENAKLDIRLTPSFHPLFTPYTFVLDLTPSEGELLQNMHSKTRYNIRVAERYGVTITEDNSDKAFSEYLGLTDETTKRQHFYAHSKRYHTFMWETLKISNFKFQISNSYNNLSAHLLKAIYKNQTLVTWILFVFQDTLYYPYGASSIEYREVMASNLIMWEAIRFGKKLGLKRFDMWGALGQDPDPTDPWYGFHRFKQGYGAELIKYVGSYDLVLHQGLYQGLKIADKFRNLYLQLKR